jgi:uncharacterized membrane protein (UPF0127 family)
MRRFVASLAGLLALSMGVVACSDDQETKPVPTLTLPNAPSIVDSTTVVDPTGSSVDTTIPTDESVFRQIPPFTSGNVTFLDGSTPRTLIFLIADTEAERGLGLMNQTDIGGYNGMLFVFDEDTQGEFYMKNTLIPLTIIFFDAQGRYVSEADMEPCTSDPCELYGATGPYRYAFEVEKGDAPILGVRPGVTIDWASALK